MPLLPYYSLFIMYIKFYKCFLHIPYFSIVMLESWKNYHCIRKYEYQASSVEIEKRKRDTHATLDWASTGCLNANDTLTPCSHPCLNARDTKTYKNTYSKHLSFIFMFWGT
jgi:hypothetical protein